mmetsp:Transcript_15782/g.31889  ORF Transcript_15782/g.31889 Transcript_15782/m.31889 type:complete len:274 (+) Transcript_15782:51-872(+)|eukprot:CAMPEP_0119069460 /NCGR_PEP_ID=MMETSP1178-20130426/19574_1 /TAXON_ID=33656 /ORGANISM="unid sp, Strain CCMP2000" /LENGTH=273 /DNA_ID=CAMNT_0007051223 /DNA_START=42 /DNA_END=863 /DNA_ORIENTATION=+
MKICLLMQLCLQVTTALRLPVAGLRLLTAETSPRQALMSLDRRSALSVLAALPVALSAVSPASAAAEKVVIFGGSGYVGAHAAQMLIGQGAEVVSVSRKSAAEQADKVKAILGTGLKLDYVSLDASTADLSSVMADATAVISCVGIAPGGANQRAGNGAVNARIADAAKAAGVGRFVYLGVASELANGPIKFIFGDYVKGKAEAEAAVAKDFGAAALIIKPDIIAGGPPGELRPPGPPGITPVSVEAVAAAAVAGALGKRNGSIDGNAAIAAS